MHKIKFSRYPGAPGGFSSPGMDLIRNKRLNFDQVIGDSPRHEIQTDRVLSRNYGEDQFQKTQTLIKPLRLTRGPSFGQFDAPNSMRQNRQIRLPHFEGNSPSAFSSLHGRNTSLPKDYSPDHDISRMTYKKNNMSYAGLSHAYNSRLPSMNNLEDDMQILKSILDLNIPKDHNQSTYIPNNLHNETTITQIAETPKEEENEVADTSKILKKSGSRKKLVLKKREKVEEFKEAEGEAVKEVEKEEKVIKPVLKKSTSKKSSRKPTLKEILWTLCYPQLWMKDVDNIVSHKRDGAVDEVNRCCQQMAELIQSKCGDALNAIYKEKNSMVLISGEEKSIITGSKGLSIKDLVKRSALIMVRLVFFYLNGIGKINCSCRKFA